MISIIFRFFILLIFPILKECSMCSKVIFQATSRKYSSSTGSSSSQTCYNVVEIPSKLQECSSNIAQSTTSMSDTASISPNRRLCTASTIKSWSKSNKLSTRTSPFPPTSSSLSSASRSTSSSSQKSSSLGRVAPSLIWSRWRML